MEDTAFGSQRATPRFDKASRHFDGHDTVRGCRIQRCSRTRHRHVEQSHQHATMRSGNQVAEFLAQVRQAQTGAAQCRFMLLHAEQLEKRDSVEGRRCWCRSHGAGSAGLVSDVGVDHSGAPRCVGDIAVSKMEPAASVKALACMVTIVTASSNVLVPRTFPITILVCLRPKRAMQSSAPLRRWGDAIAGEI